MDRTAGRFSMFRAIGWLAFAAQGAALLYANLKRD
jgi:hypothetical protein